MAEPENKTNAVAGDEEEVEEITTAGGDGEHVSADFKSAQIANQLMQSPEVLAALQDKLGGMVGINSGYIQSLPKVVKRRIKALKKLQFEMIKIESKFYEEVHELECKYAAQYEPLSDRRKEIITGAIEPTDDDCDWPSEDEDDDEELTKEMGKAKIKEIDETKPDEPGEKDQKEEEDEAQRDDENTTGIPEFWLTVFKNVDLLSDMIQEHDEPILRHLTDLKVKFSQSNPMGFTLEFFFSSNEYFTNPVLTKEYVMRSEPDPEEPFSFEGPEITKCTGCSIDWQKGKNVTMKVIKKVQKHKGRGTKRTVTKTVQNDSFFNFFNPPDIPEDEVDEDSEALLAADFEIGHFIRERLVPRAVLYFTGEALEDDEYDEEEGEEDEGDDEEDEDEDNDPDFNPDQVKGGGNPGECKQQ